MIAIGLLMLSALRLPTLCRDWRFDAGGRTLEPAGPALLEMAFAFQRAPCVAPILAAIPFDAGTSETLGEGAALLLP